MGVPAAVRTVTVEGFVPGAAVTIMLPFTPWPGVFPELRTMRVVVLALEVSSVDLFRRAVVVMPTLLAGVLITGRGLLSDSSELNITALLRSIN